MAWKAGIGIVGLGLSAALAGCAGYGTSGLAPGDPAAEVERRMGAPTGRHRLPDGGTRLEFARGPAGLHTYMVDLDAQARVIGWAQVLEPARFAAVHAGQPRGDLLRELGRPGEVRIYRRQNEEVWSYHYDDPNCWWFQVSLAIDGPVRSSGFAPDPRCEKLDDD
jgi:hypothetical protein